MELPVRCGFSLVELSIVLVILGLLVGGILAGQSLIRASELRAVINESQRYTTAIHAFRDKYFALPGDMNNATAIWGKDNAKCSGHTGSVATPGTCNGDGDGLIEDSGNGAGFTAEVFRGWQQLALAGLVEGTYTGYAGAQTGTDYDPGSNSPRSKLSNAGWMISFRNNSGASPSAWSFDYNYQNWLGIGADDATGAWLDDRILKTEEAWNIDSKMDDGLPATGIVHGHASVATCTTASGPTDHAGQYKLSNSAANQCALLFKY